MEKGKKMDAFEQTELLKKIVLNEPLIESRPSLEGIDSEGIRPGCSIYYGTGLCTAKEISVDLPFDVLSMILVAERLRKQLGMETVYHHIADTHALSNSFFTPDQVRFHAKRVRESIERVVSNLGLTNFRVVLSSEFDQGVEYQELRTRVNPELNEYVQRELTDMLWYKEKGVCLKLGWIIQSSETGLGYDERLFDREFLKSFGRGLSFLYLKAGRTLDPKKPKASPYISTPGEKRVLLIKEEEVSKKLSAAEIEFGNKNLNGARGYLVDIIRAYERLFGPLENLTIEEKIQGIIDIVTK